MTEKLKPCPFCGGENLQFRMSDIEGWVAHVECLDCDDMLGPMSEYKYEDQEEAQEDATTVWNRRTPDPAVNVGAVVKGDRIADAIEACDWAGSPIGNKEILRAAVIELRSLQAWQRGAISCREAEEARIEEYRLSALSTPPHEAGSPAPSTGPMGTPLNICDKDGAGE